MTDRFNNDDPMSSGYTKDEGDAIHQTLIKAHLKPEADFHGRILPDITMLLCDVHPDPVLYAREIRDRLKALEPALEAAATAYDQLGPLLQAHLDDQGMIPQACAECARQTLEDWEALVSGQTGTPLSVPGFQASDLSDQPD